MMVDFVVKHPRILMNDEIEAIAERRMKAEAEISRICSGERRWTMVVPVQADDSDMLLSQALQDSQRLEKEVYRFRGAIKSLLITMRDDMSGEVIARLQGMVFDEPEPEEQPPAPTFPGILVELKD